MDTPSLRAQPLPDQGELIAEWDHGLLRLEDVGEGRAIVVLVRKTRRLVVGSVGYDDQRVIAPVEWNLDGRCEIEQFRRNTYDTNIYSAVTQWRQGLQAQEDPS